MSAEKNWHEFVIVMAMDAFRLCLGMKPSKHSLDEVVLWMRLMNRKAG